MTFMNWNCSYFLVGDDIDMYEFEHRNGKHGSADEEVEANSVSGLFFTF